MSVQIYPQLVYPRVYPRHFAHSDRDFCPVCDKEVISGVFLYDGNGDAVGCEECVSKVEVETIVGNNGYTCPFCGAQCTAQETMDVFVDRKSGNVVGCDSCIREVEDFWSTFGINPDVDDDGPDPDRLYDEYRDRLLLGIG